LAPQERVEAAALLQCVEIVTTPDMGVADEDLRESPAAGTVNHFLSLLRATGGVDFGDSGALPFQQSNGPCAIGAEGPDINGDRRHNRLKALIESISIGLTACGSAGHALGQSPELEEELEEELEDWNAGRARARLPKSRWRHPGGGEW
jgi:hypothetical protein